MKAIVSLLCLVSFLFADRMFAQEPALKEGQFLVAIRSDDSPRSSSNWKVVVGEVYQFVRYMSRNEFLGNQLSFRDHEYFVLRVGDVLVASAATNFAPVPEKDVAAAAMIYGKEVAAESAGATSSNETAPSSSQNTGLSKNDRTRMLYLLRAQHVISSIRKGEQMPDSQLLSLYQTAQANLKLDEAKIAAQQARQAAEAARNAADQAARSSRGY